MGHIGSRVETSEREEQTISLPRCLLKHFFGAENV